MAGAQSGRRDLTTIKPFVCLGSESCFHGQFWLRGGGRTQPISVAEMNVDEVSGWARWCRRNECRPNE